MTARPDTLRARAAQLLMPRLGSNMPPPVSVSADAFRAEALLAEVPVGGFVLFRGSREESPAALAHLQNASRIPLLFASDLERGTGQQLHGATVFPHAMAFGEASRSAGGDSPGRMDGEGPVFEAARITAEEARACGVHWLFAPVADVHSNPANPIISTRAFGSSPEDCARHVRAFIRGCRAGGGLSTAKHFPGHGDTDTDSHDALPSVSRSREDLHAVELSVFKAAIEEGVDALMTAHVAYPALDASGVAATFSSRILRDLLRDELAFRGVVVSDSLLMGAAGLEVSSRAPELIAAGIDVLLDISHPKIALEAILDAVSTGRLPETLVQEAFERVWDLKRRSVLDGDAARRAPITSGHKAGSDDDGAGSEGESLAHRVARDSLAVTGNPGRVLAGRLRPPLIVVRPHTDYPDPTRADAASIFSTSCPGFDLFEVGPVPEDDVLARITERATSSGAGVLALVVKPAAWHAFGLLDWQEEFVRQLIHQSSCVLCLLGSPDADRNLPEPAARIVSFSDVSPSVQAVAQVLDRALAN